MILTCVTKERAAAGTVAKPVRKEARETISNLIGENNGFRTSREAITRAVAEMSAKVVAETSAKVAAEMSAKHEMNARKIAELSEKVCQLEEQSENNIRLMIRYGYL